MNREEFKTSLAQNEPPDGLSAPLAALWWDAKKDWTRAHALVDELETTDGMAVHAYLHRKGGQASNADYWYERAGRRFYNPHSKKSGRRWLKVCFPLVTKRKCSARRESQLHF
jgi:hypothetical protein